MTGSTPRWARGPLMRPVVGLWRASVPTPARRAAHLAYIAGRERMAYWEERRNPPVLGRRPRIRLLVPVRAGSSAGIRVSVASAVRQIYGEWELFVVPETPGALPDRLARALDRADPRVSIWRDAPPAGRNAALNAAMAAPGADYVAVVEPGDTLAGNALNRVAALLNDAPDTDVVYTDERVAASLRAGRPGVMISKSDWSPERVLSEPYVGRLCVYRRTLVAAAGGLRDGFDAAREYDLLLRLYERGARIAHVPRILYRRSAPSALRVTAAALQDEVARAVADHLQRVGADAEFVPAAAARTHRVRYRVRGHPLVSIVIPTVGTVTRDIGGRAVDLFANTVRSILERTAYRNFEIVYVHDRPLPAATLALLADAGVPVRGVPYDRPFNWSDKTNAGAAVAAGEHLLALNDDIEVFDGEWLSAMLEFSQQDAIGAVGAKLLFPDGSIQHAGVVLNGGFPGHPYYGCAPAAQPDVPGLAAVRNYSAVTGACLMTRAAVFREVGGFTAAFAVNYNDVDYCLKVRARGYRVVFTPHAQLYHLESVSRARAGSQHVHAAELDRLARAWPDARARDPYQDVRRRSVWL